MHISATLAGDYVGNNRLYGIIRFNTSNLPLHPSSPSTLEELPELEMGGSGHQIEHGKRRYWHQPEYSVAGILVDLGIGWVVPGRVFEKLTRNSEIICFLNMFSK